MGIFEQVLGTQFEAEIRVLHEKGKREKKGGPELPGREPQALLGVAGALGWWGVET